MQKQPVKVYPTIVVTPTHPLEILAKAAISEMGDTYLCAKPVKRKTPMTTKKSLNEQRKELRSRLLHGGKL